MAWYLDPETLDKLSSNTIRSMWAESGAYDQFFEIEMKLPKELRDRSRIGALLIAEMRGTEGKNCWMAPVEGHKKILGAGNDVKLFEKNGDLFYQGPWGQVPFELIDKRNEFFIWLPTRPDAGKNPKDLVTRIKGSYRLLKHKLTRKH